jgi:dihydroorotase
MCEATVLLIEGARLADGRVRDVRVDRESGVIDAVGEDFSAAAGAEAIDAAGKRLLPGMIDAHVHFREPGFPHKETWETGSASAAAGGVTTAIDQPNTEPPTVIAGAVREKARLAADSLVDFGINGGVTPAWDPDALLSAPITALGEVFLADSTGDMGIDADRFRRATERAADAGVPVTVHAEDADYFDEAARDAAAGGQGRDADADAWSAYRTAAAELAAVERACDVAEAVGTRIHVAHTSTPEGIDAASEAGMTCEVAPHHLLLSRDDLDRLGTFGRMNPPLRSEERREAVYERVRDGTVEVIATDHAPHTRAEKDAPILEAPSGVPGVETALPLLLNEAREGRLDYERVRDLTAANPADVLDLPRKGRIAPGYDADLVLVDPDETREIRGGDLHSKCGWTPFEGRLGVFPELTLLRGRIACDRRDGEASLGRPIGENVAR